MSERPGHAAGNRGFLTATRPGSGSDRGHFILEVTVVVVVIIAECGTGKTLMALSAIHVCSAGRPYTALVMAPPNIVGKWCREVLITVPGARVFIIDGLRTPGQSGTNPHGVNEVRYRNGRIVREGMHTTLTDLRLRENSKSARDRWQKICPGPSFFIVGRDRAELSFFWGSEQEFDKRPISRGFPENHEFGFGDGHALRLEQKVA
jgi:hypothetical protein